MPYRGMLVLLLVSSASAASAERPAAPPVDRETMSGVAKNLAFIDDQVKRTSQVAEDAREEKDLAKLVCVDDKLHAMVRLAGVARSANADMIASVGAGDASAVNANATKIAIARAKIESLGEGAERCMGALLFRAADETTVEVREPAGLPAAGSTETRLGVVHRLDRPEDQSPMVNPDAALDRPRIRR